MGCRFSLAISAGSGALIGLPATVSEITTLPRPRLSGCRRFRTRLRLAPFRCGVSPPLCFQVMNNLSDELGSHRPPYLSCMVFTPPEERSELTERLPDLENRPVRFIPF